MIRYLKFMLKRRTASAGFFSQSGTINIMWVLDILNLYRCISNYQFQIFFFNCVSSYSNSYQLC
ncbi:hypothetical protein [Candidatus Tisiphia endosymbiont of Parasteatoda lunata]|uniref:hypothetical protein n=1 Tax=Candidatus Tisiphia endosymbiont of Parasteatoda lunata TaxID=3066275 RepID=UPI00313DA1A3